MTQKKLQAHMHGAIAPGTGGLAWLTNPLGAARTSEKKLRAAEAAHQRRALGHHKGHATTEGT